MTQLSTHAVTDQSPPLASESNLGEGANRKRAGRRVLVIGAVIVAVLAGALAAGAVPRLGQQQTLDAAARQAAAHSPRVTVAVAQRMAPTAERILPGSALALMEATLYPRSTGYVIRRLVDIGDRVKEGQLLAEISAPDIDDQLLQAKGNLELSRANLKYAQANATSPR